MIKPTGEMIKPKSYSMPKRRNREGKTHYKFRLNVLKAGLPRFVIRRSEKHCWVQVIEYDQDGDRIIAQAHSSELQKMGWTAATANTAAAYLCGKLAARRAVKAGVKNAIADLGTQKVVAGGVLFAALKGGVDGGLDIPHDKEVFPSDDRIKGKHIGSFASKIKVDQAKYAKQFGSYIRKNADPQQIPMLIETVEKKMAEVLK